MKKDFYLLLLAFAGLLLSSCIQDDAEVIIDEAWKSANEQTFEALKDSVGYTRADSESNAGYIYYKVIRKGEGSKPAYYTSRVQVYYTGHLIDGTMFDSVKAPYLQPAEFTIGTGVIEGWKTALQLMKEGDRWEVWIPQVLGYGATDRKNTAGVVTIPAYSTLKFEIEVVKIIGIEE
jgi:peptidylprolyl isomerase/FKBP-type peptidyl-prolyl cis-trans isomerase FklB